MDFSRTEEGVSAMIISDTLPRIKSFLKTVGFSDHVRGYLRRLIPAFLMHRGRMSATQAAGSVGEDARHRAQVGRFLARGHLGNGSPGYRAMATALIGRETRRGGRWLFIVDKTCVSRQGTKTENTFSTGNCKRRPKKGRRYNKKKNAVKRCHGFVMGLLISPSGHRIPFHRCYYTREYCQLKGGDHRTEAELAAALIRDVPTPDGADVVVLGDTAYEAESIRAACSSRGFAWITPANPERVLAGEKPRPKLSTRLEELEADRFSPIRLTPGQGDYVAQRRVAGCRIGPNGLKEAACQEAERSELTKLAEWSRTKSGLKKLKRLVRAARPREYQIRT